MYSLGCVPVEHCSYSLGWKSTHFPDFNDTPTGKLYSQSVWELWWGFWGIKVPYKLGRPYTEVLDCIVTNSFGHILYCVCFNLYCSCFNLYCGCFNLYCGCFKLDCGCFNLYWGGFNLFCYVWACVCVLGGNCNLCVCVCECFCNMRTCIYCVLYFMYCFVYAYLFLFVLSVLV